MSEFIIKDASTIQGYFLAFDGPFSAVGPSIPRLMEWITTGGGKITNLPVIVHFDNPGPQMMENWRGEIVIDAVAEDGVDHVELPPDEPIEYKTISPEMVASVEYDGPVQGLLELSQNLLAWLVNEGYTQSGPLREVYLGVPRMEDGNAMTHEEMQVPVQKD